MKRIPLTAAIAGSCFALTAHGQMTDQETKMSKLPAAVQATVKAQTAGGTIKEIEKETEEGKTFYEVDFMKGSDRHEIKVDESGKVMSEKE